MSWEPGHLHKPNRFYSRVLVGPLQAGLTSSRGFLFKLYLPFCNLLKLNGLFFCDKIQPTSGNDIELLYVKASVITALKIKSNCLTNMERSLFTDLTMNNFTQS